MPTINVGGILVSYEECTENYEKALATNGQIDSVAAELEYYLNAYSKIEDKSSSALDNDSSLYNGIMSSVAQIPSLSNINAFTGLPNTYKIIVPDNLYDNWIVATNWCNTSIVSHIVKFSVYYGANVTYRDNTSQGFDINGTIQGNSTTPTT